MLVEALQIVLMEEYDGFNGENSMELSDRNSGSFESSQFSHLESIGHESYNVEESNMDDDIGNDTVDNNQVLNV